MTIAIVNGILGTTLCFILGLGFYDLSPSAIILAIFASNLAGFLSLMITLRAERIRWLRRYVLRQPSFTWFLLVFAYLAILLSVSPEMREPKTLAIFVGPLVLSTGFFIVIFGPIRDALMVRKQLQAKDRREHRHV